MRLAKYNVFGDTFQNYAPTVAITLNNNIYEGK
jgi:hypothetical protein